MPTLLRSEMPHFRVRGRNGRTTTVIAGRVVHDGDQVRFQSPDGNGWTTVSQRDLLEVQEVHRRVNESNGLLGWVAEREINDSAAAAHATSPKPAAVATPAPSATARDHGRSAPASSAVPVVSARDIRCPQCGEQEELSGRRDGAEITLTCDRCGYVGPRTAQRTCPTCGGSDVVDRPKALVERSRGTQLSVVGYSSVALCRACDREELEFSLQHNSAVLPKELPTVDPAILQAMRTGHRDQA